MNLKKLSLILIIVLLAITACGGDEATEEAPDEATPAASESVTNEAVTNEAVANEAEAGNGEDVASDEAENAAPAETAPTATAGPVAQSAQLGAFFAINEVGLGPDGFVTLNNFTSVPVSLAGSYLCQGSDCFALPDVTVNGGDTVRVAAGDGEGLEDVIATEATFGELRPADGELALFASDNTEDPAALLLYFEWGATPHDLTAMAIEKGLWLEGSYAPSGPNGTRLFRIEESGWWQWE